MNASSAQPLPVHPVSCGRKGLAGLFDYTLFVGPSACFHHSQDAIFDPKRTSALCLDDTQLALGLGQRLVGEAIDELMDTVRPRIVSLRVLTSCQSAFTGADYRAAARSAARRHGIVCVHQQNNRMTVAGRCNKGLVSGVDDPQGFAAGLLDCASEIPTWENKENVTGTASAGHGVGRSGTNAGGLTDLDCARGDRLVFMSDALALDPRNELLAAAEQWGLSRVQTLSDWGTPAGIAQGAAARLAVVASPGCQELAREAQRRWELSWLPLPVSYDLAEIDAHYRLLGERLGGNADVAPFRQRAERAIDQALAAIGGRPLSLDLAGASRPWHLARALLDAGFRVERIGCSFADRTRPVTHDADYGTLLATHPGVEEIIAEDEFIHRKSKLVDDQGACTTGANGMPDETACWGYFALQQCMDTLREQVANR